MKSTSGPIEDRLITDHIEIKRLYDYYNSSLTYKDKQKFYNQIAWELARHAVAEEIVVYPCIREKVPDGNLLADDAIDDDRKTKQTLSDLNSMDSNSVEFSEKFRLLMLDIYNHIDKEEKIHIPKMIERIPLDERINLGQKFDNRKLIAPTRPHPWTADKYPFLETIEGVLLAPIDKFIDLFKSFPESETVKTVTSTSIPTTSSSSFSQTTSSNKM